MSKVVLYHQKSCPQCKMVETLLKKNNISYEEIDDTNLMIEKGINHTPTLEIDGVLYSGKEIFNWINSNK